MYIVYDIVTDVENQLIIPIISETIKIISILGGLTLWLLIIGVIIKAIESKLGPTGWARAAALWDLFSNFKWFIVTMVGLYATIYTIALLANYVSGSVVISSPAGFAGKLIYEVFFGPFIQLWNSIT